MLMLTITALNAEDILDLMQEYTIASELSNKTKNENAGNLIIYTRDDLERMQALTLKDILKSLRYYSYSENRQAQSELLNVDSFSNNSKGIRLYLNNHELLSPLYGSGFVNFGDMELQFIDHVEIYTGFPSFEFGVEPAMVVIRLYTKGALHDEGGKVSLLGDTNSSHMLSGYYSDKFDDVSYFSYISQYNNQRESYENDKSDLQRNQLRNRFYGSISTDNHSLELHATQSTNDAFLGKFLKSEVVKAQSDFEFISLSTYSQFLDKTMSLSSSFTYSNTQYNELFNRSDFNLTGLSVEDNLNETSATLGLDKKWVSQSNVVKIGLKYRYKNFDISKAYFNDVALDFEQAYDTEHILSAYIEDLYSFNKNNTLSLSLMNQFYRRNGEVNEPDNLQLRFAYIYSNKHFTSKTTLSSQSFAAEPFSIVSGLYGNANLASEAYLSAAQEFIYRNDWSVHSLLLTFARLSDYPIIGEDSRPINSDKELDIFTSSYQVTFLYSTKDSLELQVNYTNADNPYSEKSSEVISSLIRSLNTFGDFDIFNEFWVVSPAFSSDVSIDFSSGIKYRVTKDFSAQVKGVNLLNKAEKRAYFNGFDTTTNGIDNLDVSVIDRRVWFGLEYLF